MTSDGVPTIKLPAGVSIPVLGQGTWYMGEDPQRRAEEIDAIRTGLDLGMTLIDTAEMYGDGKAEELIGEAIAGRREDVFLVSKVLPVNATARGTIAACERSLQRLRTDRLDLYLLHWRGDIPLEQTLDGFERLIAAGKVRYWGVSNFDVADLEELLDIPTGADIQTDQVLYNLTRRGIEYDLLPWCLERDIPIMAYSPFEQGRLLTHPAVQKVASRHGVKPAQVVLAWVLRLPGVAATPKASSRMHVVENRAALEISFTENDLSELDSAFPPPTGKAPLEMI